MATAESQITAFIAKFDPNDQRLIGAVRRAVRKRLPTAHELVYDNYSFFVIGYSPTDRPSDAIVSIAAGANGLGLRFIHGAALPDPTKVLLGAGRQTRFIRLESAAELARPEVEALVAAAIARSKRPLPASGRGTLIIRSVSANQRLRRRPATSSPVTRSTHPKAQAFRLASRGRPSARWRAPGSGRLQTSPNGPRLSSRRCMAWARRPSVS